MQLVRKRWTGNNLIADILKRSWWKFKLTSHSKKRPKKKKISKWLLFITSINRWHPLANFTMITLREEKKTKITSQLLFTFWTKTPPLQYDFSQNIWQPIVYSSFKQDKSIKRVSYNCIKLQPYAEAARSEFWFNIGTVKKISYSLWEQKSLGFPNVFSLLKNYLFSNYVP